MHGAALGDKEIAATREAMGWTYAPFDVPADVYAAWNAKEKGQALEANWDTLLKSYGEKFPQEAAELARRMAGELPGDLNKAVDAYIAACVEKKETIATRKASQNAIQALAPVLPEFLGGSADLTGSNLTNWKECVAVRADQPGNHINYGAVSYTHLTLPTICSV